MRTRTYAILLGLAAFGLIMINQRDVGIARDETVYFHAGDRYVAWWSDLVHGRGALTHRAIAEHWGGADNNSEHPPLMKTLFGLSEAVLNGWLGVGQITAYRAPTAAMHALLIALVFLWTASIWGTWEGLIAGLLLLFMPRLFFHAGLACFDAPMVAVWFGTVVAYHRGLTSRRWGVVAGVAFGLALATKHNALLLPPALVVHAWIVGWPQMRADWRAVREAVAARRGAAKAWTLVVETARTNVRRLWRPERFVLVAMAVLGPLTLIALWPWLWFDTAAHVKDWLGFHLHHVHYNFEYLGRNWNHPPFPWHVALITTLYTVPVVTLAAAALGARVVIGRWWRARRGELEPDVAAIPPHLRDRTFPGLLLLLSAGAAMGPFFLGSTPIFGAEKHWAPAMPAIAIAAGIGAVWAALQLAAAIVAARPSLEPRAQRIAERCAMALTLAVVGAAGVETFHAQPYALSEYNALAGGAPGGADLGMNRQFWGYSAAGVLPELAKLPPGPVYAHDASPAWGWYQRLGRLPAAYPDAGAEDGGVARSSLAIVIHERHFNRHDYMIWKSYGTVQPVYVLRVDGVPIVSVYRRPASGQAPSRP